jgi:hypothetical protein
MEGGTTLATCTLRGGVKHIVWCSTTGGQQLESHDTEGFPHNKNHCTRIICGFPE